MTINLCKYDVYSRCASTKWATQAVCVYSIKSNFRERCMWCREDGTCSNHLAQAAAYPIKNGGFVRCDE